MNTQQTNTQQMSTQQMSTQQMSTQQMSTTNPTEPVVVLEPDQVTELRHLLGTIEDWLLHCGDDARDDLAAFLAGRGWAPHGPPERLAANLVDDLGEQALALARALHEIGHVSGPST